jgi:starch synthase
MKYRILMVASELFPLAKAGGLADAVADVSTALAARGHDVRVVLPRYYIIDRSKLERPALDVPLDPEGAIAVYETRIDGHGAAVTVYLLDHEAAYGRDGVYTTADGEPFEDNAWRFSLLSRAALSLCRSLDWKPDILHGHDWPAGLIPAYLRELPYRDWFEGSATVFTIHNLGYQGTFALDTASRLALLPDTARTTGLTTDGQNISFLRSALSSATALTTVSPTYAKEILHAEHGFGLEPLLRERRVPVRGILNGIDYDTWNPGTDPLIPINYDENSLQQKPLLRRVLRWYVGLPQEGEVPLIGMVTRMVEQKGFTELLSEQDPALLRLLTRRRIQLVMLGSGPAAREHVLHELAGNFQNLAVITDFDNRLAHLIEAASDFFLMPSRYEPCGLNQMYSLRYGTIPIVTRTGGLADTVVDVREDEELGTGYLIPRSSPRDIYDTVCAALDDFDSAPKRIAALRRRGMEQRFTWDAAAADYEAVYREAVDGSEPEETAPEASTPD